MAHIHNEPGQHDHTVSIYLFRTDLSEPKVMLHMHKKIGLYAQFGGHIELNETPWQTIVHELAEETGYGLEQVKLLQPANRMKHMTNATVHPYPIVYATMGYGSEKDHFHTDSTYAFITNEAPANSPAEGESTDLQLFTRNEIVNLSEIDGVTRDTALYIFDNCLTTWQPTNMTDFQ